MQFTRPNPMSPFQLDATVTANQAVADRLLAELGRSEWGSRLVAVGDVPGFVISFTFDTAAASIFDVVTEEVRLDAWLDETLVRITSELYTSS